MQTYTVCLLNISGSMIAVFDFEGLNDEMAIKDIAARIGNAMGSAIWRPTDLSLRRRTMPL